MVKICSRIESLHIGLSPEKKVEIVKKTQQYMRIEFFFRIFSKILLFLEKSTRPELEFST